MRFKVTTILIALNFSMSFTTMAQKTFIDSVIIPLNSGKIFREKAFVHVNKSIYSSEDIIWFKAYVGGPNNQLSTATSLLFVDLIDPDGKILDTKNVLVFNGTGKGQFDLDVPLGAGKHYIRPYTNNMRNFGDGNLPLQEIRISGHSSPEKTARLLNHEVQIFPEGGILLEEAINVFGVKVLVNGEGAEFTGKVVNTQNEEVTTFEHEHLGMSKFSFFYEQDEEYKAIFTLKDTTIYRTIPLADKKGLVLSLDNSGKDTLQITLRTNERTLAEKTNENYNLLFHQKNNLMDYLEITDFDSLKGNIKISKDVFFEGVNCVTVFKGINPIIERKFHVEKENFKTSLAIKKLKKKGADSIPYKISIFNENSNEPIRADLSISVLPANTSDFRGSTNIKAAFLLSPYIKGFIESPAYYFDEENPERKKHMDILLLTQGWVQYKRQKLISSLNPKPRFSFQSGIKVEGEILSPLLSQRLALIGKNDVLIDTQVLNGKKRFTFENLLLFSGDTVKISFLTKNNEALKPGKIQFFSQNKKAPEEIFIPEIEKIRGYVEEREILGATKLKEVIVTAEKVTKRRKLLNRYRPMVWDIGKYMALTLPETFGPHNNTLMKYLNREGVRIMDWKGMETYLEINGGKEALLYIDGERVKSYQLSGVHLKMDDVENIMVQPIKGNRIYQVFTTDDYRQNIEELFIQYIIKDGYDRSKKYYKPLYDFNWSKAPDGTEIDWKPEIKTNSSGEAVFNILDKDFPEGYLFLIQGISDQGLLISEIIRQ